MADPERLAVLRRKLAASMRGSQVMGGYEKRVAALKAEIARLEGEASDGEG